MANKLKIEPFAPGDWRYKVTVDDVDIKASELWLSMAAAEVPEAQITVHPRMIDSEAVVDLHLHYEPEDVKTAASLLRFELQVDDDLRRAFIASIKSALDEAKNYLSNQKLAENILDRIVGV